MSMIQTRDRLIRYALSCARAFEEDASQILADDGNGNEASYAHENYKYAAAVFLALYLVPHSDNPRYRDPATLAQYRNLADCWVRQWEAAQTVGTKASFCEWPYFIVLRGLERVRAALGPEVGERWERFCASFADATLDKPFFFTAPNHECWGLAACALAGRVLNRPEWVKAAEFKAERLLASQTPEGFWEEGRHHGPSMKYNSLMLAALALLARETGSRAVGRAAARLASFMAQWCFPDGVTVGAFDGRQSASPGYFGCIVPGLDLAPGGQAHMARIMDFWERAGWLDRSDLIGPSAWYAHFGMPFAAESLLYYDVPDSDDKQASKENDADALLLGGCAGLLENHTTAFDGVMRRSRPWCVALSGQMSDVPKDTQFIYRLERQSRMEIHHDRASTVIGGGHSLVNCVYPLYNAWIESGYRTEPDSTAIAQGKGDASSPESALRRSKYYARGACTGRDEDRLWLELVFAHALVRFQIECAGDRIRIGYRYQAVRLKEMRLALPLVLWRSATAHTLGRALAESGETTVVPAGESVTVDTPAFGTRTTLTLPEGHPSRIVWPLDPVRTYGSLFPNERFSSFFRMALVETVIDDPGAEGSGHWTLRVEG